MRRAATPPIVQHEVSSSLTSGTRIHVCVRFELDLTYMFWRCISNRLTVLVRRFLLQCWRVLVGRLVSVLGNRTRHLRVIHAS